MLIRMGFNKTGCLQDALCGLRQTGDLAAFDGGEITSDAGALLLSEQARRIHLFERMAGCFTDHRDRERLTHALPALLAQRVCGMALGYSNDRVSEGDILRGHFDAARRRFAASDGPTLVLHDTTEFTWKRKRSEAVGFTTRVSNGKDKSGRERCTRCADC